MREKGRNVHGTTGFRLTKAYDSLDMKKRFDRLHWIGPNRKKEATAGAAIEMRLALLPRRFESRGQSVRDYAFDFNIANSKNRVRSGGYSCHFRRKEGKKRFGKEAV